MLPILPSTAKAVITQIKSVKFSCLFPKYGNQAQLCAVLFRAFALNSKAVANQVRWHNPIFAYKPWFYM
jgi:hypothetical protein